MPMTPFTGPWYVLLLLCAGAGLAFHLTFVRRPLPLRTRALAALAILNVLFSVTFHVAYLTDESVRFPFWQNLPLHLCTITSWLLPVAVLADRRPLRVLMFFPGVIAGALALASAGPLYWGHPVWDPKTFFWVAHALNAVIGCLIASLGLYRPTYRDAVLALPYTVALAGCVLPVTLLLRATVEPGANYFFVFDPEGAGILELLHTMIPVPILYEVPLLPVVLPVFLLQVAVFRALSRIRPAGSPAGSGSPSTSPHGSSEAPGRS
ncbi:hypothetical protein [Myceligenerans crystallogenes]|uniref:Integral membrane protein (Intg_mem_TP0381) n=1 Tax=Myceligenerans crystallogenes TaxID=316335 RepID=A0ABN2NM35_9MICO